MRPAVVFLLMMTLVRPASAQTAPPHAPPPTLREAAHRASVSFPHPSEASEAREAMRAQATPGQPRPWPLRHPVLLGTLVGIGVGFPVGLATCHFPTAEVGSCEEYSHPADARLLGGLTSAAYGAGIGAGVGALVALFTR